MIAMHILAWVAITVAVIGLGALLRRPKAQYRIEPPRLVHSAPATLRQAVANREKVDDYYLQIREEQHTLRQRLDRADLDKPDAEDELATFNIVPIEKRAKAPGAPKARAKRA